MTVIITGTLQLPADVRETRSQKGCRHYVFCADPGSATQVCVYENWDSVEDLAAHLAGPYYQNMLATLIGYGVTDPVVSKYRVDLEEPIYDPEGRPRADFFTA